MAALQSLHIKRALGALFKYVSRKKDRRVILTYHAVGSGALSIPVKNFINQMDWLARHATVETLGNLVNRPSPSGLRVAITFDDGYRSVYSVAAPILEKHGFPSTVYLNTALVGEETHRASDSNLGHYPHEEFLLWKEVAELDRMGWTIGSHGVDHVDLTRLTDANVAQQLRGSRGEIESRLGKQCRHFCYTWGNNSQKVRHLVSEAGYDTAVAAIHGTLHSKSDLMALERVDVRRDYCLNDFKAVIEGDWDYLSVIQRLRRIGQ